MKKYVLAMLLVVPSFSCAMDGDPLAGAIKVDFYLKDGDTLFAFAEYHDGVQYSVCKNLNGEFFCFGHSTWESFDVPMESPIIKALKAKLTEYELKQQNNE